MALRSPALLRLAAFLLPALACVLPAAGQNTMNRTLPASPTGYVDIELFDGSVKVAGWDKNEVQVSASLSRPQDRIEIEETGSSIELEIDSHDPGSARAQLELKVPRGSRVRIEVLSASVEVAGVTGEVEVEAVAGSIKVAGRPHKVRASGVTGEIQIAVTGSNSVDVDSVSGSVTIEAEARAVDAETVAGALRLKLRGVENGRFEAVSGSIDAEIVPAPRGRFDVESFSGSTVVAVPAGVSARFELETANGRTSSQLTGARERRDGKRLEIEQGSGDAVFRLESFSGAIEIRPLGKNR